MAATQESNTPIRIALIAVIILFAGAVWFAYHMVITRQETAINTTLPPTKYTNYVYKINLSYPSDWQPAANSNYDHYVGPDGFFMITAAGGATSTIDDIAAGEARHVLKPYGSAPTVDTTVVNGQPARVIMPSRDQDASLQGQAALIVKYPKPVTINHQAYSYFVLYADKAHIADITHSLSFVEQ